MEDLVGKEILLGTYEAFVLGYKVTEDKKELFTSFADHAHSGSVRAIAAADKFMISSGDDENVKIFNLRRRTEHGALTHADGTINAMKFYDRRHLFTGAEDGRVSILKTGTWRVEKTLLKHQSGVLDIAIHPSGKLGLSIGKDRKLVTWNLIKGRSAYVTNIKDMPNFVKWSPTGEHYLIGFYKRIDFYSTSTASIDFTIALNGRSNDVVFIDDVTFAVAGEMPQVEFYSLVTRERISSFNAHEVRVRCLALVDKKSEDQSERLLVTASNDGYVKVWSLTTNAEGKFDAEELTSVDTKCRITCMAVHEVPEVGQQLAQDDDGAEVKEKTKKKSKKAKLRQTLIEEHEAAEEGSKAKKAKIVTVTPAEDASQADMKLKKKKKKSTENGQESKKAASEMTKKLSSPASETKNRKKFKKNKTPTK